MFNAGTKKDQLVEEFHVQLYSSGRIDWDNLDSFIPKQAVDHSGLMTHLRKKLTNEAPPRVHAH